MRIVQSPNEFVDSFMGAQREAAASFGVNTILLEKYITKPRHIEVQVLLFGFINRFTYSRLVSDSQVCGVLTFLVFHAQFLMHFSCCRSIYCECDYLTRLMLRII